jgi:hypothetical protein
MSEDSNGCVNLSKVGPANAGLTGGAPLAEMGNVPFH